MTESTPVAPAFKDRSTVLTLVGVLQIVLGALAALAAPMTLLPLLPFMRRAMETAGASPPSLRNVAVGATVYLLLGVFFVWTGIGAVAKRRWVRPIMLSASWLWLVSGLLGMILAAYGIPRSIDAALARTPDLPRAFVPIMTAVVLAFASCLYVLIPGVLILAYRSPDVRATLESRDPVPRWTDRCPVPVFGMSLFLTIGALSLAYVAALGVFPCFTILLTGPAAWAFGLVVAGLYLFLARAAFRREPIGWWGTLALFSLMTASAITFFTFGDLDAYVAAVGMREREAEIVRATGLLGGPVMVVYLLVALAAGIGYLLWVRRYFVSNPAPQDS